MLNDRELKGHSVTHPFEEERRGHQQTEDKKYVSFFILRLEEYTDTD